MEVCTSCNLCTVTECMHQYLVVIIMVDLSLSCSNIYVRFPEHPKINHILSISLMLELSFLNKVKNLCHLCSTNVADIPGSVGYYSDCIEIETA